MIDPLIQNTIDSTRRGLRGGLARELLLRGVFAFGLLFWVWLLVDWLLEPSALVRLAAYGAAALSLGVWLWRGPLSALAANLSDARIAALLEHRHPELADTLLTSLAFREPQSDPVREQLLQDASRHARDTIAGWEDPQVIDLGRQRPWLIGAALTAVSLLGLVVVAPSFAGVYLRR
ncbi:MAG: hypothetical protein KDA37_12830, partial [Planctomycetales bacterium]|nr:hypothetical protein [Planctomycetales bacterium]